MLISKNEKTERYFFPRNKSKNSKTKHIFNTMQYWHYWHYTLLNERFSSKKLNFFSDTLNREKIKLYRVPHITKNHFFNVYSLLYKMSTPAPWCFRPPMLLPPLDKVLISIYVHYGSELYHPVFYTLFAKFKFRINSFNSISRHTPFKLIYQQFIWFTINNKKFKLIVLSDMSTKDENEKEREYQEAMSMLDEDSDEEEKMVDVVDHNKVLNSQGGGGWDGEGG